MTTGPDDVERRIESAKQGLDEKLSELQRRVDHTKAALSPRHLLANPWLRFGVAATAGFVAARVMSRIAVAATAGKLVKKLAVVAATSLLREAFEQWRRGQILASEDAAYGRGI